MDAHTEMKPPLNIVAFIDAIRAKAAEEYGATPVETAAVRSAYVLGAYELMTLMQKANPAAYDAIIRSEVAA